MKIAYFDTPSGIAGDMTVAALLDAAAGRGATLQGLREAIGSLGLDGWRIDLEVCRLGSLAARRFQVDWDPSLQPARDWASIRAVLEAAAGHGLGERVAGRAIAIFTKLAEAEAQVHGVPLERVHFHEVGAVDSIIDIVGAAWCLERMGIQECFVGRIATGSGHVDTEHGRLPVPAPATALLLRGFDLALGDGRGELVTPTGAAILAAEATPMRPSFRLDAVGNGAGTRVLDDRPNVLRVFVGEAEADSDEEQVLIEADIDDMSPEAVAYAADRVRALGARDVTTTPVAMKKGRLGVRLTVLCDLGRVAELADVVLAETTTLGLRYRSVERRVLARRSVVVETPFGRVAVKIGVRPDGTETMAPEFEDVARLARETATPFLDVHSAALRAAEKGDRHH